MLRLLAQPPRMEGPSSPPPRAPPPATPAGHARPAPQPQPTGVAGKGVPQLNRNEDLSFSKLRVLRFLIGLSGSLRSLQPVVVTNSGPRVDFSPHRGTTKKISAREAFKTTLSPADLRNSALHFLG